MTGRVDGKVAFITGAARGQGRSHALRLAQEGADIIAVDVCGPPVEHPSIPPASPDDLAETAEQVKALDRRIVTTQVDVRDFGALKQRGRQRCRTTGATRHHRGQRRDRHQR